MKRTSHGFAIYAEFNHRDYNDSASTLFTVQESSLATERKVWIGTETRAHLNEEEARIVAKGLIAFLEGQEEIQEPPITFWKGLLFTVLGIALFFASAIGMTWLSFLPGPTVLAFVGAIAVTGLGWSAVNYWRRKR